MFDDISRLVDAKVQELHPSILLRAMEMVDRPQTTPCSYSKYIGYYVDAKIRHFRLNNDRCYPLSGEGEIARAHKKMTDYHNLAYSNPCYTCNACLSRKKPWPPKLVDETLPGGAFIQYSTPQKFFITN